MILILFMILAELTEPLAIKAIQAANHRLAFSARSWFIARCNQ